MKFSEYLPLAQRTANPELSSKAKITNGCIGMISETGEIFDILKKNMYMGMPDSVALPKIKEELGDVMWYFAELYSGLCSDREKSVKDGTDMDYDIELILRFVSEDDKARIDKAYYLMSWCVDNYDVIVLSEYETSTNIYCTIRYIIDMCRTIQVDIYDLMDQNIEKLRKRYPDGFDEDISNSRYSLD